MDQKKIKLLRLLRQDIRPYFGGFIALIFVGLLAGITKSTLPWLTSRLLTLWERPDDLSTAFLEEATHPIIVAIREQMAPIFNYLFTGDDQIVRLPLVILVCYILSNIARFIVCSQTRLIAEKICIDHRKKLLNQYLQSPLSYLEQFKSGSGGLISRMLNDINQIYTGFTKTADLLKEPIVCCGSLLYLLYVTSLKHVFFLFVLLTFVAFFVVSLSRSIRRNSRRNQENLEEITSTLKETLDGSRIIRSFNLEDKIRIRFQNQVQTFYKFRKKITILEEASGPITESFTTIIVAAILIIVGLLIKKGEMTVAEFMGSGVALGLLFDSAKKTQDAIIRVQQGLVARTRLEEILMVGEEHIGNRNALIPMPQDWSHIQFKNINYRIGDRHILKDINITIKRGETIALVGPSGSGKTSLLNLLERFISPESGEITIGDTNITSIALHELRRHISLVSQDVFLFRDTLEENIRASIVNATHADIESAAKAANVHSFIESLPEGYQTLAGDRGQRLSGGEKQRISIARAFLKNAPILLLDEATSALDTENEVEVQKGLQGLMKDKTCFVVAHRLSTIKNADRIIVLKNGEVVQVGTHDQLAEQSGEYNRLLSLH